MILKKQGFSFLTGAASAGLLAVLAPGAWAQNSPVLPNQIDRSVIRPGTRSLGLGGTILFGSGVSAAAYNPAAISQNRGFGVGVDLVGRSENVDVAEVKDIIDSVEELNDAVEGGDLPEESFNDLFEIARGKTGRPLRATATPSVGVSLGISRFSTGVLAFSEAIADVRISATGVSPNRRLDVGGGLLGLSTVAVPVSLRVGGLKSDYGTVGVNLKMMRADYLAASFNADENPITAGAQSVTGTTFDAVDDAKFGLDLGYISPNLTKGKPFEVQTALAIRNVIAPKFDLRTTGTVEDAFGNQGQIAVDGSFKQQMQIDLGLRARSSLARVTGYAELHNLTKKNGGDTTFHIGAEYAPIKMLALRAGYDDDKLTAGLGLRLFGSRLDLAVSQKPEERFALGFSFGG
jgi:hypothetical protein